MKYYDNSIYPIALVLSNEAESVNKEYYNAAPNEDNGVKANPSVLRVSDQRMTSLCQCKDNNNF